MPNRVHRALFVAWGWAAIVWVLAIIGLGLWLSPLGGTGVALLIALWFYDMGETTCSRCSAYGTGRCGVQSWIVPLMWRRKTAGSVSRLRVRLHYYFDLLIMAVGVAVFCFFPVVLPFYLLWLAVGWWIVYQPKQFHGLLPLLRESAAPSSRGVMSLPVLSAPRGVPIGHDR